MLHRVRIGAGEGGICGSEKDPRQRALDPGAVWRMEEVDRKEAMHREDSLGVGEGAKAFRAAPAADARVAGAAEGEIALEDVPRPVIDRHATGVNVAAQPLQLGTVRAEVVE